LIYFLRILLLSNVLYVNIAMAVEVDIQRGEVVAAVRCGPCHHMNSRYVKVGPGLAGIYGMKPSIQGVPFDAWDTPALQTWLTNPRQVKPNTRMLLPAISARDRSDIIAWLKASVITP